MKAAHCVVRLAQIAVAPVDNVGVSSEDALLRGVRGAYPASMSSPKRAHSNLLVSIEERERTILKAPRRRQECAYPSAGAPECFSPGFLDSLKDGHREGS